MRNGGHSPIASRTGRPRLSAALLEAEEEILAHMESPAEHWRQISSTNPLERLNKEIDRRTRVVGIFPDERSLIRLIGAVLCEQNDEWMVGRRYMSRHSLARIYQKAAPEIEGEVTHAVAIPVHRKLSCEDPTRTSWLLHHVPGVCPAVGGGRLI